MASNRTQNSTKRRGNLFGHGSVATYRMDTETKKILEAMAKVDYWPSDTEDSDEEHLGEDAFVNKDVVDDETVIEGDTGKLLLVNKAGLPEEEVSEIDKAYVKAIKEDKHFTINRSKAIERFTLIFRRGEANAKVHGQHSIDVETWKDPMLPASRCKYQECANGGYKMVGKRAVLLSEGEMGDAKRGKQDCDCSVCTKIAENKAARRMKGRPNQSGMKTSKEQVSAQIAAGDHKDEMV